MGCIAWKIGGYQDKGWVLKTQIWRFYKSAFNEKMLL